MPNNIQEEIRADLTNESTISKLDVIKALKEISLINDQGISNNFENPEELIEARVMLCLKYMKNHIPDAGKMVE